MSREQNLGVPFTFQFNVTTSGTPEQLAVKIRGTTIAFVDGGASADTITDSGSGFLLAGFQPGDQITVSGASNTGNNSTFEITAVTAGVLTLHTRHSLTTEAAGATVKIVAPKSIPNGIAVVVKAKYANTGVISLGRSTESAFQSGVGCFNLRSNESVSLQLNETTNLWLDTTVSGEGVEVIFEKNIHQTT